MKFDEWNQWNETNLVPFDKNEAKKLSSEMLDIQQMGHGESKFAEEIKGTIYSSTDFDVLGPDGRRWEVKQVNCEKKQFRFRITIEPDSSISHLRSFIRDISDNLREASHLLSSFNYLDEADEIIDKLDFDLNEFSEKLFDSVQKGNISKGLVFGRKLKTKEDIIGVYQVLDKFHEILQDYDESSNKIEMLIGNHHDVMEISAAQYAAIVKFLDIDPVEKISIVDFLKSELKSPAFKSPEEIFRVWNSVDLKEVFLKKADGLVIVDEVKGFFPIVDFSALQFSGTSGKDACIYFVRG